MHAAHCTLHAACCTLYAACCMLHAAYFILHTAYCILPLRLAAWDMLQRSLPAAILLEDDAKMPSIRPTLWDKLAHYTIPSDAVSEAHTSIERTLFRSPAHTHFLPSPFISAFCIVTVSPPITPRASYPPAVSLLYLLRPPPPASHQPPVYLL